MEKVTPQHIYLDSKKFMSHSNDYGALLKIKMSIGSVTFASLAKASAISFNSLDISMSLCLSVAAPEEMKSYWCRSIHVDKLSN